MVNYIFNINWESNMAPHDKTGNSVVSNIKVLKILHKT